MATKRRFGFTLVELLVVIAIITILMSILLPALKKVEVLVGQGMCAKQLQTINHGFHGYSLEFNDKLPFVSGTANLPNSYAIDGFVAKPNGFGCVYEAKLFENHNLLYCPAGVSGTGYPNGARDSDMENFPGIFEQRGWLA
ncbi:MAG TPA: type II secretion system protein, partial [Phycisphaerae bacterium]|nr:type II secretion system protein [Phycisphaerae bacterium]